MTRIAQGAPPRRTWFAIPVFAYAIPALIVLLVATFLIFRSQPVTTNQPDTIVQAPAVQPEHKIAEVSIPSPESVATVEHPELAKQIAPQTAAPNQGQQKTNAANAVTANKNTGKVITFGQGQAQTVMPEGISPKPQRRTAEANSIISPASVPVADILGMLGMTVKYESEWKVAAIAANSAAQRSGVKAGDVVTAINDRQLTSDTAYNGSGTFTSITVRRGGETMVIKLK